MRLLPSSEGGPEDEGKRRSGAPRGERPTSLGVRRKAFEMLPAPFGAPLPSPLVREHSPREPRGWEIPAHPAPRENRGGGALATSRKREGEQIARKELRQHADFPLKSIHLEGNPAWNAAPRWSKSTQR